MAAEDLMEKIKKNHTYRNSEPTTSVLTITSNVVYGKLPVLCPMVEQLTHRSLPVHHLPTVLRRGGLLASLNSVAKLPYEYALMVSPIPDHAPSALGHNLTSRKKLWYV